MDVDEAAAPPQGTVGEVASFFLRLGFTAFGGPAAHIAMMREALVRRRKWVTEQHFLDLLGATNLIPGPNSTEMTMHLGQVRAGWGGMVAGGACFISPAMCLVLLLAWAYGRYGALPQAQWLLYGIKPVIIAVVAQALWGLSRTAIKGPLLAAVGVAALALYLLGGNEVALLLGGGVLLLVIRWAQRRARGASAGGAALLLPPAWLAGGSASPVTLFAPLAQASDAAGFSLGVLFLTFLKIGAVLYGSGYVLLAFLRNDFVHRLGWLTDQQLLDAVAIGQFTPGPVFTTATFVGYIAGSHGGQDVGAGVVAALLATLGIFLPSFLFVAAVNPLVPRLRRSPVMGGFLDGVNVAALGLMAAVTWELGRAALVDWLTVLLAILAAVALIRFKVNSVWLILVGAAMGLLVHVATR